MSVIATAARHLIAAGVTGEALIAAIADMEADVRAEPKERSAGAIRQERYRHNKASRVTESDACDDTPPLSRPPNENISNPPTHTPPDMTSRARKADEFPRLECASPELWGDFLKNRAKKNLPNTASAHRKLVRELEAMAARTGWPPGKVFEACVEQGWGAIYETDEMKGTGSNGRLPTQNGNAGLRGSRPDPALDMLYQAQRELAEEARRENTGFDRPPRIALPAH